jgi:hypothetical protein
MLLASTFIISGLDAHSGSVTAIATILLALITAVYVFLVQLSRDDVRKQRDDERVTQRRNLLLALTSELRLNMTNAPSARYRAEELSGRPELVRWMPFQRSAMDAFLPHLYTFDLSPSALPVVQQAAAHTSGFDAMVELHNHFATGTLGSAEASYARALDADLLARAKAAIDVFHNATGFLFQHPLLRDRPEAAAWHAEEKQKAEQRQA